MLNLNPLKENRKKNKSVVKKVDGSGETKNETYLDFIFETLETFLTSFIVLMVIYWTVALPEVVQGASMEPTFYTGERILVEKITKRFSNFNRGDIVILHPPGNDNVDYVKRIVGVEGDVIKILNCGVYIARNSEKFVLEEPYLYDETCTMEGPKLKEGRSVEIKTGEYLVLGDNRERSADSRVFGLIKKDRILGKVIFRFWPFEKAKLF